MNIKKRIDKIPGGLMLLPLFTGAIINTFFPDMGTYFGSFTNGLMTGTIPILAVWFFCMGATIKISATRTILKKSGILVLTKVLTAWIIALIVSHFWDKSYMVQSGLFAGFSILTLVASMDMTNGGLYAALMNQYGTKEEAGAFILMTIESGPLVTMLILGTTGVASFDFRLFVGAGLPFIVGMIIGNMDKDLRIFFGNAVQTLIPFFAFALGHSINLNVILQTGFAGILLGCIIVVVTGVPLYLADRYLAGGNGVAGIAASSTAGAAVSTPFLIAQMLPDFKNIAEYATAMVATSVIVTSILVPILTSLCYKWKLKRGKVNTENVVGKTIEDSLE